MKCVLFIVTALLVGPAFPEDQPIVPARFFKVPANTAVRVRTTSEISSETAHVGDDVQMEVLGDVAVNGVVVIRQGAAAIGQISSAKEARNFGRHGHVALTLKYVEAVTGEHVPAAGNRNEKAPSKAGETTAEVVATSVLLGAPAGALWMFDTGPESKIPPGTAFSVYTASDTTLDLAMLTGEAPPSPNFVPNDTTASSQHSGLPRPTSESAVTIPALGIVVSTRVNVGAEITGVVRDSPADKAGLHVGDVINAVDRKPVRNAQGLVTELGKPGPGSPVRLGYVIPSDTFNGKNGNALVYYPKQTVLTAR